MIRLKPFPRSLSAVVLMALSALSFAAYGQSLPQPTDFTGILSSTPPGDWSMKLWRYVFGDFADNPFAPGGPTTLMGNLFLIFNTAVFTVGFVWAMYGIVAGVVATAHEGEVLGKRLSTVWFPIRMVLGIAGMVPIFKGMTMAQALMMMMTAVGIGIGNHIWTAGVNSTSDMQALVNDASFSPTGSAQSRKAVEEVFMSAVCLAAQRDAEAQHSPPLAPSQRMKIQPYFLASDQEGGYRFGTDDDPSKCGYVSVQANARTEGGLRGFTSFRAGGVNYAAIEAAASQAYKAGMTQMVTSVTQLAQNWYLQRKAANDSDAPPPDIPMQQLDAINTAYMKQVSAAIASQRPDAGTLKVSVKENMTALGWFGAGAWFSTFAEANAAMADAAKGPTVRASSLGENLETQTVKALEAASAGFSKAQAKEHASAGDGTRALLDSALRDYCNGDWLSTSTTGTATGNCSLGQGIVSAALRASAVGSGGGGNGGGGSPSLDSAGLVNPIIALKNIGDYLMSFSSTVLIGGYAAEKWLKSKAGAVAAGVDSVASKSTGKPGILSGLVGLWEVLKLLAILMLAIGALLSIYIPLVPFIVWIGAILAYAASVIEGLAGATLHAMSHLDGDGDGLGQRTSHGYLFLLNVVARPALMVLAFFIATGLMIVVGTLQAHLFLPAMANVQGNSLTGIFSIGAFVIIFGIMNITLISACFNLIHVIPDQVIGFVGAGNIHTSLGRDTEDKAHNVFMVGARFAPMSIDRLGALKAVVNKDKASDTLKAAGGGKKGAGG